MFFSIRIRKSLKTAVICILAFFIAVSLFSVGKETIPTFSFKKDKLPFLKAESDDERYELLKSLGWKFKEVYSSEEVVIPKRFDEIYSKYNEIQKEMGLNLARHKGKKARKYTYFVTNYPDKEGDVRLTLLVRRGKVIGGDVCFLGKDGFMDNLFYPNKNNTSLEKEGSML